MIFQKDFSKGIPRFYFPKKKADALDSPQRMETFEMTIRNEFKIKPGGLSMEGFAQLARKLWACPTYLAPLLFQRVFTSGGETKDGNRELTLDSILKFWRRELAGRDEVERCFRILKTTPNDFLVFNDFIPLLEEIVANHPGLKFLSSDPEFQEKYTKTVITRFFYKINRALNGHISLSELRKSNFLDVLKELEEGEWVGEWSHVGSGVWVVGADDE